MFPCQDKDRLRCQNSSLTTNVSSMCNNLKYLGQIPASDGKVKREVSRRLALGYAAFNRLGKQGIWKDKAVSRKTKLTLHQVIVQTVLLYCAETWPIGTADVNKLETAHMSCLHCICGGRSWEPDCTPYA
jgi:hypothetical protein